MRVVACLLAVLVAAGPGLAGTPGTGPSNGSSTGSSSGSGVDVDLPLGVVPDEPLHALAGSVPVEAPAVQDLADTGLGAVDGVVPGVAVPDVTAAVGEETAAQAVPATPPAQAAAPIAAVGSAAAAWHLRFVPWRRLSALLCKTFAGIAFLPVLGMFSRIEDDELKEHPVRARILQVLQERPGASIQELQGETDVAWGTVVYHLGRLSQARHVVSQKDGRNHRFWTESDPEARNRKAAFVLKRATPAAIAATVRAEPGIHQGALCDRLAIRPATASKYLKRLAEEGLVTVTARAQRRHYYPTPSLEAMSVACVQIRFDARATPVLAAPGLAR